MKSSWTNISWPKSQTSLSDTIEMTREAWITSDSLHIKAYICGGNQNGKECTFTARSANALIMKKDYVNKGLGYRFSFATSSINPEKVRILSMTIGANNKLRKMGWVYRMGIIKFIT